MNEKYGKLIMLFEKHWKLAKRTATLISTAMMVVSRHRDSTNAAKTCGILMAYNAAGIISEGTYYEGYNLVDSLVKAGTEREALDLIYKYFEDCD